MKNILEDGDIESALRAATAIGDDALQMKARGYVIERQDWTGDMEAIQIVGKTPVAVSDPRQRGVSVVVR